MRLAQTTERWSMTVNQKAVRYIRESRWLGLRMLDERRVSKVWVVSLLRWSSSQVEGKWLVWKKRRADDGDVFFTSCQLLELVSDLKKTQKERQMDYPTSTL